MKKIFKTAIVAAMSFLALGMMSCQKDDDDHEILEQTGFGANAQWTIDYTNESGTYNRGFNVLSQKHTSGTCTVTIGDFPECGVAGFVFGKTNNPDGTANFGLVGIKRHTSTALKYYVSWYKNVDLTKMDGFNNFAGTDGKVANGANNSCKEIDKTSGWKTLDDYITAGAPASIVIKVEELVLIVTQTIKLKQVKVTVDTLLLSRMLEAWNRVNMILQKMTLVWRRQTSVHLVHMQTYTH